MKYNLTPDKPRKFSDVYVGAIGDARWRGVPDNVDEIDCTEAHINRQRARDTKRHVINERRGL